MAKKTGGSGTLNLRNNNIIYAAILLLMVLVLIGSFTLIRNIYQTETYYVLNQDVPTRTQISPDMLSPVVTSEGSAPINAKGVADIQGGGVFSRFPLVAGDILTNSNVSMDGQGDIANGIPDTWVVTSFSVGADNAVGGRIRRGDYFDMLVADSDGSFYPFVNMLALDTTVSLSSASSNAAADTEEAHAGQTTQYVVGMSPGDAARLHQVVDAYGGSLKLILAPRQNQYAAPQLGEYSGVFLYEPDRGFVDETNSPKNMGEGTDYTFSPKDRDEFGRPLNNEVESCSPGNGIVTDPEVCANMSGGGSSESSSSEESSDTSTPAPQEEPAGSSTTPPTSSLDEDEETPSTTDSTTTDSSVATEGS